MTTNAEEERLEKVLEQLASEVSEANGKLDRLEGMLENFIQAAKDRAVNIDARLKALEERANGAAQ